MDECQRAHANKLALCKSENSFDRRAGINGLPLSIEERDGVITVFQQCAKPGFTGPQVGFTVLQGVGDQLLRCNVMDCAARSDKLAFHCQISKMKSARYVKPAHLAVGPD